MEILHFDEFEDVESCAHSSTKFCLAKVANETNFPLANKNFH